MAIAGTLEVQMLANLARLQADMTGAKNIVGSSMKSIEKSVDLAKNALGALGIGLSVGAFINLVHSTIEAADAMNDLSQRVGIAVADLAKYELAAAQSGTTMEALAKGIKGVSTNMLEHGDALKAAGITATTADGAMQQLADVFSNMPDGMEKTALAVKLFGKAGMDLIPMLNNGSTGLEEAALKSAKYAAQMAILAPASDRFNDSMAEITMASKVMGMSILNNAMPRLEEITKAMAMAAQESGVLKAGLVGIGGLIREGFGKPIEKNWLGLNAWLNDANADLQAFFGNFKTAGELRNMANEGRMEVIALSGGPAPEATKPKVFDEVAWKKEYSRIMGAIGGTGGTGGTGGVKKSEISEFDKLMTKLGVDVSKAASEAEAALNGYNKAQTEFVELTKSGAWKSFTNDQRASAAALYALRIESELATATTKLLAAADLAAAEAHDNYLISLVDGLDKAKADSEALRETNDRMGLSVIAIAALDASKLEAQAVTLDLLAIKTLDKNLDQVQYDLYRAQSAELRTLAQLKLSGAMKSTDMTVADNIDKQSKDAAQVLHDDLKGALSQAFRDSKDPIKAFGDALGNVIFTRVTNSLADAMATQILGNSAVKSIGSFFGMSFDGGGYTGSGSRSGGMDGKGGFPAILHPNETVFDHTKGQQTGGVTININATVGDIASKSDVVAGMRATANQITSSLMRSSQYGGAASR